MTRDQVVEFIKKRVGWRTGTSYDSHIIDMLKYVQRISEHSAELPWFLIDEILTVSTVPDEQRVLVPTGFLREVDEGALWRYDEEATKWTELIKEDFDHLKSSQQGTGAPRWYSLLGRYFRLFPTPDAVYPLKVICYVKDAPLDSDIQNKWLEHAEDFLVSYAAAEFAGDLENRTAEKRFLVKFAEAKARLTVENEARAHANRRYAVGGRH